jgi:hypothetical protein
MAMTALMKHVFQADCCDHLEAGHTERRIPATYQIT